MKRFLFLLVFVSAASVAHAQGVVQLSTYYPSPFGKYDRIQLVPRPAITDPTCDPGTMYINNEAGNQLEVCNAAGNAWAPLSGGPWTQIGSDVYVTDTSADVGIGTDTPTSRLHIYAAEGYSPAGVFIDTADIDVNGGPDGLFRLRNNSGGAQKMFFSGSAGDVLTVDTQAGLVGIGTTSPSESLHVKNASSVLRLERTNNANRNMVLFYPAGAVAVGNETWGMGLPADANYFTIGYDTDTTPPGTNVLNITNAGNVGIGTTSPDTVLHVKTSNNIELLKLTSNASAEIILEPQNNPADSYELGVYAGNFSLSKAGSSSPALRILGATGNVGIGTTAPQAKFHVDVNNDTSGSSNLGDDFIVGAEGGVGIGTTPLGGPAGAALYIKESGVERLAKIVLQRSSTAKYLGIDFRRETGATEWSLMPSIEGGGSPSSFEIWEGGSSRRFVIKNATGNVGIGTADPGTNKLEVAGGPIKATGGLIIETRTSDPAPLVPGQMWLCTDPAPYCDGS